MRALLAQDRPHLGHVDLPRLHPGVRSLRRALARGVFLAPSAFEAGFVSSAHSDADIEVTIKELDAALDEALRG